MRSTGSRSLLLSKGRFGISVGLTACVSNTKSQVWPSGAALATAAAPIEPELPGRFSTMIVAPRRCCSPACASRAMASTDPPGGNGAMRRMIPDGQLWARAAKGAAAAAPKMRARLVSFGMVPPGRSDHRRIERCRKPSVERERIDRPTGSSSPSMSKRSGHDVARVIDPILRAALDQALEQERVIPMRALDRHAEALLHLGGLARP